MRAEQRRAAILKALENAPGAVSASTLAEQFGVSRQVVVGDVALLRALGTDILATPRGYELRGADEGIVRRVACRHTDAEMERELNAIVDQGCTVADVIVEHPLYGQLTGSLQLKSRYDVGEFLSRCARADARPLSDLTEGIHLHTLVCPDETAYERVRASLHDLGFLLEN
ncbi:MAG: transcription repressor NadR [Oscillospiraceae bacterium]|nr:transcription repressor NadR [Oscillospiraceae bacterium]